MSLDYCNQGTSTCVGVVKSLFTFPKYDRTKNILTFNVNDAHSLGVFP